MEKQYCENCGKEILTVSGFCDGCGISLEKEHALLSTRDWGLKKDHFLSVIREKIPKIKNLFSQKKQIIIFCVIVLLFGFYFYQSYQQTQQAIFQTSQRLEETNARLIDIASSTNQKIINQENELNQKTGQIAKLEADLKKTPSASISSSNVSNNVLTILSPSVVKIICYSDSSGDNLQMGSGVLYYSNTADPASYFVETNLHVVKTSDGSASQCAIAVYPSYRNTSDYLVYKTTGYTTYKYGVDFVYIMPQLTDSKNAGTLSDLKKYAKTFTSNIYCKSTNIGDHVSILGYPSIGGSSLTATDGIISGFEYDEGSRFIKTSAKIEHGNSGGVAIEDSGCILGIPTFVQTGSAESIGRILDLNDLFNL